jgi:hypothetical protein
MPETILCESKITEKYVKKLSACFIKNSEQFIQLFKIVNLQSLDTLISFDVLSHFTNIAVNKALQSIGNKFHNDDTLENGLSCRLKPSFNCYKIHETYRFSGGW